MSKTTTKRTVLNWRSSVSIVSLIAASAFGATATAQTAEFDIEAGNAADALNAFARQADRDVVYAFDAVEGIQVPGLEGTYDINAALNLLLTDTGLEIAGDQNGAIAIRVADLGTPETTRQGTGGAASGPTGTGEPVSVEGTVKGAITDSNLAGARVEIVETGQVTATDNLGRFRFAIVAPGTYTLRISYLGRETIQETIDLTSGGDFSQSYSMGFPASMGITSQVEVLGNRSAREQALNQERTAENTTTIITADQLGTFNGTTISEVLRRAPGVAFVPDPETGDGANIIVRGLEPDLNQVTLNGIRLLDSSGRGRSPDLSGILTESIESVTINKSLLPSQDTNGAGGLIEIETKSPLDRPAQFASFGLEYGWQEDDFGEELLASGTISRTFGVNQDFGVSLSASYRDRDVTRVNYNVGGLIYGEYLPEGAQRLSQVDPRLAFPFDGGGSEVYPSSVVASQGDVEDEIFTLTGTVEKEFGSHTNIRFDATLTEQTSDNYQGTTSFQSTTGFSPQAIDELGGAERFALATENPFEGTSLSFANAIGIVADLQRRAQFSPDQDSSSLNLSFRGETTVDDWDFDYTVGYNLSESSAPVSYLVSLPTQATGVTGLFNFNTIDTSLFTDEAQANTINDRIVSVFAPLQPDDRDGFVLPLFTQEGFATFNDIDQLPLSFAQILPESDGEGEALTLQGSARRTLNLDFLDYVEAGFNYQDTEFSSTSGLGRSASFRGADGVLPSDLGLAFGPGILTSVGASGDFSAFDRGSIEGFSSNIDGLVSSGLLVEQFDRELENSDIASSTPGNEGRNETSEETLAAYLQASATFGKLELIGGVRVERLELSSTYFTGPTVLSPAGFDPNFSRENGQLVTESTEQTDVLPRINANYRFDENMILRGSYYTTVSRPQLVNLTTLQSLFLNITENPVSGTESAVLVVRRGNPDLEPSVTHNFGLDFEYYFDDVGIVELGLFYKEIEDPLQATSVRTSVDALPEDIVIPDIRFFNDLPEATTVTLTDPVNGENNHTIWGVELGVERRLSMLPSPYDGIGIIANYTYTDSERDFITSFAGEEVVFDGLPFIGSPEHSGTAGLTYNKFGVDASLLYSVQDRRLSGFANNFLNTYDESVDSLDLFVNYNVEIGGANTRFFLRGTDLLKGPEDTTLQQSVGGESGVPKYFTNASFFGGRTLTLGASVSF